MIAVLTKEFFRILGPNKLFLMRFLSIIVLLAVAVSADAQKIRFTDTSNRWHLLATTPDGTSFGAATRFMKDTFLAGQTYHVLGSLYSFAAGTYAMREDTVTHKLFFRILKPDGNAPSTNDTLEHVLFNYNLQLHDTFQLSVGIYYWKHVVQSLDSVQLGGNYYKVWNMHLVASYYPPGFSQDYLFIEGIGTNHHPSFNTFPAAFEGCYQLRCFSNNGVTFPCTPHVRLPCAFSNVIGPQPVQYFDNDTSCAFSLAVTEVSKAGIPVLFPNPGGDQTFLKIPASIHRATLIVTDGIGRVVLKQPVAGGVEFPIGRAVTSAGMYFYCLQNDLNGQKFVGQFCRL